MVPEVVCEAGKPVRLKGYAIDAGHAVARVEFSLDDGKNWTPYLTDGADDERRVNWTFDFIPPKPGVYELLVRSVNDAGKPSPGNDSVLIRAE